MHSHLAEFDLRYSTRTDSDGERAACISNAMEGCRLIYRGTDERAASLGSVAPRSSERR